MTLEIEKAIKQSSFRNNRLKAQINLIYTYNWLRDNHQPIFKKHKLLSQHYNVLRIVRGKHPKPVTPGEIIDVMLDKKRDLTRLVDKLVSKGLLHRQTCPSNRRKVEIFITEKGMQLVEVIAEDLRRFDDEDINLTEEEAATLSNLLDKMRG
jgi:DNA-binding MarR family transcriptional regulator